MVINLQKTRMDPHADLVIHAKCDDVMRMVLPKLGITLNTRVIEMPGEGELRVIKDSYRPDPPPIVKHRVKRIKVCTDDIDSAGRGKRPKTEQFNGVVIKKEVKKEISAKAEPVIPPNFISLPDHMRSP